MLIGGEYHFTVFLCFEGRQKLSINRKVNRFQKCLKLRSENDIMNSIAS